VGHRGSSDGLGSYGAGSCVDSARGEESYAAGQVVIHVGSLALALGFAIDYVDSGSGWYDTGVSAAAVLGVSGSFGLLYSARPWLWGLAMGAWIAASGLVQEFNFASLMALVFSFAGAYTGAVVRRKFIIFG
jgi:hypothetical protein